MLSTSSGFEDDLPRSLNRALFAPCPMYTPISYNFAKTRVASSQRNEVVRILLSYVSTGAEGMLTAFQGKRHTVSVVRDLFWKPFDVRFGELLECLHDHQELFDIELRIENQKAIETYLGKLESEIFLIGLQLKDSRAKGEAMKQGQEDLSKFDGLPATY
jgi:hypothetical protein